MNRPCKRRGLCRLHLKPRKYLTSSGETVPDNIQDHEAQWGKRMIEVQVRFWTNDLAEGVGHIQPKARMGR
jgi:hypothetical protein